MSECVTMAIPTVPLPTHLHLYMWSVFKYLYKITYMDIIFRLIFSLVSISNPAA